MDASDTIRRRLAIKTFVDIKNANKGTQVNANCGTCGEGKATTTPCKLTFSSYRERRLYLEGKNACNNCSCTN